MGIMGGKEFAGGHLLHYTRFFDNKLYVYLPEKDKFFTFHIYRGEKKFNFYGQESISISSGAIYLIGGQSLRDNSEELSIDPSKLTKNMFMSSYVAKINLNKHDGQFKIDLEHMRKCDNLPQARASHLLVHKDEYIYAIGGYLAGNEATRTCLRFHKKDKKWAEIATMGSSEGLVAPCGLAH